MNNSEFKKKFSSLLNSTNIEGGTIGQEFNVLYSPIAKLVTENIPQKLFRYRVCSELNIESFDKDTIWAVNPSKFNDPHDSLSYVNRKFIQESITNSLTPDFRKSLWVYYNEHKSLPNVFEYLFGSKYVKEISNILSVKSLDEVANIKVDVPLDTDIYALIDYALHYTRNSTKIACMSESVNNSLMWAHYADYHKGFVLEYNFKDTPLQNKCSNCLNRQCPKREFSVLYPVIYNKQQYDATEFIEWYIAFIASHNVGAIFSLPKPDELYTEKIYLHKSKIWKYEKEWRLICDCSEEINSDAIKIENNRPVAIYYGTNISSTQKKILQYLATNKGLKQYQMYIDYNSKNYKLKASLIK